MACKNFTQTRSNRWNPRRQRVEAETYAADAVGEAYFGFFDMNVNNATGILLGTSPGGTKLFNSIENFKDGQVFNRW